ncbi:sulfoxide reductase catalytic subunit YedY precursor [Ferrovum sp. JA12]|uniref:protein-methionine-sulfoxide reductase catalytic subunit MsrP n=1 Tax=Ferrovum sp. JA12 TaxID=1356299 RepID=UPI00070331B7|nr:protein-methionine-sulfoxide reductase catalytic subunit MsrP [Ferrovum sp. JA12]KRH78717.1 sulfoxide reductase catalytic subunit YedY precursor [Ferrovum sp. JA12]
MILKSDSKTFLPSDITSESNYLHRRQFLKAMGIALPTAFLPINAFSFNNSLNYTPKVITTADAMTSYQDATHYNNYYEFGTDKTDPAQNAGSLITRPWHITIEGLVKKNKQIAIDELINKFPLEERIYHHRCVEAWSMVIPWVGLSLKKFIHWCEPTGNAKFIEFVSLDDPTMMPGVKSSILHWPYTEALRMDEATHPLTILAVGMYGKILPNQNGAPVRLVVPWKYGFKGIKSIVKVRFVEQQPATTWNITNPNEYGFYSNVNPLVDHPRWSQATERRIGDGLFAARRRTLMFNGYADQVAHLYTGMDLKKYF